MKIFRRSLALLTWLVYFSQKGTIDVLIRNKFALKQMNPSNTGYAAYQFLKKSTNFLWLIPLILTIVLLIPELKQLNNQN